jgi:sugar phosphate isomerase/epimerase
MTGACQRDELNILGKEVFALHVQDNFGNENEDLHLAPLFGNLDIDSLMTGLLDIGYNGYFTFEATLMLRTKAIGNGKVPKAPLEIRKKTEELLYEIGKHILSSYGVFEE